MERKFGSNTQPKNFGKGGELPKDWECICGNTNKGNVRYTRAGREFCQFCGIDRELSEMADTYALRCPVCEGLDYPGLNHNTDSPECSHHA